MLKTNPHSRHLLLATATAGLALAVTHVFAADPLEIVVEAAAPVHSAPTGQSPPGGASVDLLSVKYHVHLGNLDLTKHADVVALQDKITEAAKKGCKDIQNQYPLRPMSDEDSCVKQAVANAMLKANKAIADAQKKPAN